MLTLYSFYIGMGKMGSGTIRNTYQSFAVHYIIPSGPGPASLHMVQRNTDLRVLLLQCCFVKLILSY